jgi:CheY-like chemotaxis protein
LQHPISKSAPIAIGDKAHPQANALEVHEKGFSEGCRCEFLSSTTAEAIREAVRCCIEAPTNWQVCREAKNGRVALDMVRELNPDVVVLDLSAPDMNGVEVARKSQRLLRVEESSSCSPPTIVSRS